MQVGLVVLELVMLAMPGPAKVLALAIAQGAKVSALAGTVLVALVYRLALNAPGVAVAQGALVAPGVNERKRKS